MRENDRASTARSAAATAEPSGLRPRRLLGLVTLVGAMVISMVTATQAAAAALPARSAAQSAAHSAAGAIAARLQAPVTLKGKVAPRANIRSGPGTKYKVTGSLKKGKKVTGRLDPITGWYYLGPSRYISKKVVTIAAKPAKKPRQTANPVPGPAADPDALAANPGGFEAGNIISDEVFYNSSAMTEKQVRAFITRKNAGCTGKLCLRKVRVDTVDMPADQYCGAYTGRMRQDAAAIITAVSVACGLNPQVIMVTLQKETGLITRAPADQGALDWAWGWNCPAIGADKPTSADTAVGLDTSVGAVDGSAADGNTADCDPQYAGFFTQAYGVARQFAQYRLEPSAFRYRAGKTVTIPYSPTGAECGSAPVRLANTATASLYNFTPYQPNTASLAGYPGVGDACSSYGNRNFYFIFSSYFGSTGGGAAARPIVVNGLAVTVPASPFVPAALAGQVIIAPSAAVARGIAAGLAELGRPYVWGGGTSGGPADQGCARGSGQQNSCQGTAGFDCSGLTAYVLKQAGVSIPTNSTGQRAGGRAVRAAQAEAGDIIGYPGHVTIYLGTVNGVKYMLEAPYVGGFVRIFTVYASAGGNAKDKKLHRYWS